MKSHISKEEAIVSVGYIDIHCNRINRTAAIIIIGFGVEVWVFSGSVAPGFRVYTFKLQGITKPQPVDLLYLSSGSLQEVFSAWSQ